MLPLSFASAICNLFAVVCAVKLYRRTADTMHIYIAAMGISDLLLTGAHCLLPFPVNANRFAKSIRQ